MVKILLSHAWKKFTRSVSFEKELATTLFVGFFGLMIFGYAFLLGLGLERIVVKGLNQTNPVAFVNGLVLYYFGFEFMMRYFMQNLPVLDVQPYLHLPLKRSRLVHFLLIRSGMHLLNLMVLVLFTPFAFTAVATQHGTSVAWGWILSLWGLSMSLHYIVLIFKKGLDDTLIGFLVLVGIIGGFALADYYAWFKLSEVSAALFRFIIINPLSLVGIFALLVLMYAFNYIYFLRGLYPDELAASKGNTEVKSQDFAFLQNFGQVGEWVNLELKLILRNKRPRAILSLSAFFLLYGLIFYTQDKYTKDAAALLVFVSIFITGIFMINYGQMLFSWQGSHFDFTLTRPISLVQVVESKYWLLTSVTLICFLLSIPYVYFGWNILLLHLAAVLFNVGINVFVIMNLAMWEPKKIDLSKGSMFNQEGIGAAQWVMGIPILVAPYIFYLPLSLSGHTTLGIVAIGVAGLIGLAFRPRLLKYTTHRLASKRYSMAAGFRKE